MRIVQITPGSGDNFYCENCLRDIALVKAVRALGHDMLVVPLYLPLSGSTEGLETSEIFYGGINVYLQQKLGLFRRTPRWLDRLFDNVGLLDWVGKKAGMTSARDLGQTTVSMLEGEQGRQGKELDRLTRWLREQQKPDVVILSNILLVGLARQIKQQVGCRIVCMLQDEDGFLDGLPEPYCRQAWEIASQRCRELDGLISVSRYYRDQMQKRLGAEPEKMHVAHIGIALDGIERIPERQDQTIGFLSRLSKEKGLDVLVSAYMQLKKEREYASLKLKIAGGRLGPDVGFVDQIIQRLDTEGYGQDVEICDYKDPKVKEAFFQSLSVLCVPEPKPVSYGLYVLEALSRGIPVVEPDAGVFPELSEMTGGLELYTSGSMEALTDSLRRILSDQDLSERLSTQGSDGVRKTLDIRQSANRLIECLKPSQT